MSSPLADELSDALEAAEAASPVDAVEAVTGKLSRALGDARVSFLIADLAGRALVRLGRSDNDGADTRHAGDESAQSVPLGEGAVGRVVAAQRLEATQTSSEAWRLLAPVSQRGEVIGLLEIDLDREPDREVEDAVQRAAHILAFVVIANRRHTDLFEWGQRSARFELSAEIQRRLLPAALTCEASELTMSAWLEPAATIGGDTFDYALDRQAFHLSVTDAMGHGVASALIATVCVSSLRNSRRASATLQQQASIANDAVRTHAKSAFATGLLGRVDLRSGVLRLVNAGHVPPVLMRGDTVEPVTLPVDLPFGLNEDGTYRVTDLQLEPGDRLAIVTDGMLERRAAELPLTEWLTQTRMTHPREATRQLADAVLGVAGQQLADDATVLILDWHGPDRDRDSRAGADVH